MIGGKHIADITFGTLSMGFPIKRCVVESEEHSDLNKSDVDNADKIVIEIIKWLPLDKLLMILLVHC